MEKSIFPDKVKIPKVASSFTNGDNAFVDNPHHISVLPCFSKMLGKNEL